MAKPLIALAACLWITAALAEEANLPPDRGAATEAVVVPDNKKIEQALQALPWNQFKSVIESIPKMKADVDAYGPWGWSYVQANYKTYAWKKNIDRLDQTQKQQLLDLLQTAKASRHPDAADSDIRQRDL